MNKKLCIVVPYRDRAQHLEQFIPAIVNHLKPKNINYEILIVEQTNEKPFNRAKLLNVGYAHTKGKFDYYVFHDIDMLPIDADYDYCENPTHLATKAEQFNYNLPYHTYFGGVTLFDKKSFVKINGYANEYWGWGAEDDDMFNRCNHRGLVISRKQCSFRSLPHGRNIVEQDYKKNLQTLSDSMTRIDTDGLNSLTYNLISDKDMGMYKLITVSI
jgi:hypothetical protein